MHATSCFSLSHLSYGTAALNYKPQWLTTKAQLALCPACC
jgi:hypothetical protein